MGKDDTEKRFRHLLHAFELGLLSDQEREEFELLLLENDAFYEEVLQAQQVIQLLKEDDTLKDLAAGLTGDDASRSLAPEKARSYRESSRKK